MKWPWVPRSLHDEAVTELRGRLDRSETARESLTQTIIDMKVAGGMIPRPATGFRQEPQPRDAIDIALDENETIAATPGLRRQQGVWARKQLKKGVELESILEKIALVGTVPADFLDDDDDEELNLG